MDTDKPQIKEITMQQARRLVQWYHYLGGKGFRCSVAYGLYQYGEIVGAIVFHSVSAPETVVGAFGLARNDQSGIFEIGRLVLHPKMNGENYGSYLISNAIKLLRKKTNVRAIITYADSQYHVRAVYQASNFKYYGLTDEKRDFYVNGKIRERGAINQYWFGEVERAHGEWKPRPRKHRYAMVFDKSLGMKWQEMKYPKRTQEYA